MGLAKWRYDGMWIGVSSRGFCMCVPKGEGCMLQMLGFRRF